MSGAALEKLRIDKWLWRARIFKSRTLAAKCVAAGRLRVNRSAIKKANFGVRPGDVLTFTLGPQVRVVEIVALGGRRGPSPEARTLYNDLDPPPRRAAGSHVPGPGKREPGAGRPTKRERRVLDRVRQSDGAD